MTDEPTIEPAPIRPDSAMKSDLSPREWEVARLVAEHHKVPAIAERMGITEQSVHRHLEHITIKWSLNPEREVCSQIAVRIHRAA